MQQRCIMKNQIHTEHLTADRLGIAASLLCSIHCILPSLLIPFGFLGWIGSFHHWGYHAAFLSLAIVTAYYAFNKGYKRHHRKEVLFLAITGLLLFVTGMFLGGQMEFVLAGSGGIVLALAHVWNSRLLITG